MTSEQDMNELEHTSVCAPIEARMYRIVKDRRTGYWHWSTICSLLLINEAHCYSVLGSSDQALEGGKLRSRTARWRPTRAGDRCMLSIVLIETSAAKECEVDCRKLSQVRMPRVSEGSDGKSRGP